jgi:beta-phosphoglucomutase-like phosphatase (HAD superfamily)
VFTATLFDYNGVLVDDEAVHLAAFRDVLSPLGVEVTEAEYVERYLGYDDVGAFRAILRDRGRAPTDADVAALVDAKRPFYLERARGALRGFAGATELVKRRAAVGPVAVVSGALRHEIHLGLDLLGVRDLVGAVVSAEDAKRSKPDPQGYLLGLEALSLSNARERCVVIEDSLAGVESARAASLACVGVGHSYPLDELRAAGADLVVSNLDAITEEALTSLFERLERR